MAPLKQKLYSVQLSSSQDLRFLENVKIYEFLNYPDSNCPELDLKKIGDKMHAKDLSGKDIVDSNGDTVGVVDDLEIDVRNKMVTGIIAKEGTISGKLGMGEERVISMDMVDAIGDKVVLRRMERRM